MTSPDELVEKMASADFDRVFPERKGDFSHPLNKDIANGLIASAKVTLRTVLAEIQKGEVAFAVIETRKEIDFDVEMWVELQPDYKKFMEAK